MRQHLRTALLIVAALACLLWPALFLAGCEARHTKADAGNPAPQVAWSDMRGTVHRIQDGNVTCWWVVPKAFEGGHAISCLRNASPTP